MRRCSDVLGRLYVLYAETNERHFGGLLPLVPLHVQRIQRRGGHRGQVGQLVPDPLTGVPRYIVLEASFVLRSPWSEVREILLHEIVHVWQAVYGHHDKHGTSFRQMARRLGISQRAVD